MKIYYIINEKFNPSNKQNFNNPVIGKNIEIDVVVDDEDNEEYEEPDDPKVVHGSGVQEEMGTQEEGVAGGDPLQMSPQQEQPKKEKPVKKISKKNYLFLIFLFRKNF